VAPRQYQAPRRQECVSRYLEPPSRSDYQLTLQFSISIVFLRLINFDVNRYLYRSEPNIDTVSGETPPDIAKAVTVPACLLCSALLCSQPLTHTFSGTSNTPAATINLQTQSPRQHSYLANLASALFLISFTSLCYSH
jgi:hypothetical protein